MELQPIGVDRKALPLSEPTPHRFGYMGRQAIICHRVVHKSRFDSCSLRELETAISNHPKPHHKGTKPASVFFFFVLFVLLW
jgi:hypothetical protein